MYDLCKVGMNGGFEEASVKMNLRHGAILALGSLLSSWESSIFFMHVFLLLHHSDMSIVCYRFCFHYLKAFRSLLANHEDKLDVVDKTPFNHALM